MRIQGSYSFSCVKFKHFQAIQAVAYYIFTCSSTHTLFIQYIQAIRGVLKSTETSYYIDKQQCCSLFSLYTFVQTGLSIIINHKTFAEWLITCFIGVRNSEHIYCFTQTLNVVYTACQIKLHG